MKKRGLSDFLVRRLEEPVVKVGTRARKPAFRMTKAKAMERTGPSGSGGGARRTTLVAVLDLGTYMGGLPELLRAMTGCQGALAFHETLAPVPAGLLKGKERLLEWLQDQGTGEVSKNDRANIEQNVLFDEFSVAAENIRTSSGVEADYIIGLTPAMVAGLGAERPFWNYFSAAQGRVIMVSTHEMREFAKKAKRPFEAAVGGMMVATLLAQMTDGLEFHEDRGCLFDHNPARHTVVRNIRKPMIEPECLALMTPGLQAAALKLLECLKKME